MRFQYHRLGLVDAGRRFLWSDYMEGYEIVVYVTVIQVDPFDVAWAKESIHAKEPAELLGELLSRHVLVTGE